jgi:HAE1 family hydrophobic/amphiphilic exporter-1
MVRIFIERPVATTMFYLALLILGVYSYLNTPLELAPNESFPKVTISAGWPSVSPEIIQTQVTAPLEEAASAIKGVKKMTSTSQIGSCTIDLEFDPKTNMEFATLALREEIAKKRRVLPPGVRPSVVPYVPEDFRVQPFLTYTISGAYSLQKLREILKDKLEFGIGSVKGVAQVSIVGGSEPEIRVLLNKNKLKTYDIQPYQVIYAISQRLQTYPAGRVRKGNQEYLFKFADAIDSIREIEETKVASSGANALLVKDVADVSTAYSDIQSIHRINGKPTVSLTVLKEPGTNSLKVAKEVKNKLEAIKKELPPDLVFKTVTDESEDIRKNLNYLYQLAGIITVIVFLMVFVVLRRLKPSLLILSSVAFSVVITFNLIYILRISMNMLTLGALAMGFGMFVDNAIVVFENTLRLREQGLSPVEAAIQGPQEVFVAVLASTLTTVAVFSSFPFFQGKLKIYYLPLAMVIVSALIASLFVAFSLIPALSPRLLEKKRGVRTKKAMVWFERFLGAVLKHPAEVILIVVALLFGSYKWFRSEVVIGNWYPFYLRQYLYISVGMPPGTDIERTDETIRKFEEKVLSTDYEKEMNARIMPERAYIQINFPPEIENSYRPYVLKEELIQMATQFAGLDIGVSGFDPQSYYSSMGAGTYYSSRIAFYGYNLKKLKDITGDLEKTLKKNPRIKDVRTLSSRYWWRGESFENILKIDKVALRKYDIDPAYLYAHLQTLVRGNFGRPVRIRTEGKEIAVSVKFPDVEQMDMRGLQDALIRTRGGEFLRLGEISVLTEKAIAGSIDRENQQFQQTIMWEFRGPAKAEERYRKAVYASLHLPPGFSGVLDEGFRMTQEEKKQIWFAIFFALLIVLMILASLYESFVHPFYIILSVPLGLIGVFVAYVLAKYPFDPTAYIGVVLLIGIVVNNAILLVSHINLKRKQGLGLRDAVIQGTKERVRPIFMTTTTTVFGILPLLIIQMEKGKRQIWSTLGLTTAGGLVTSTIFMLVVIPIFYFYGDRVRGWAAQKVREVRGVKKR